MSDRNWDAELKRVDHAMEHVSDEAMLPAKAAKTPGARAAADGVRKATSTLGVFARLSLAVALGVAIAFWPYASRCGLGLAAYLGAVSTLIAAGVWSSIWTWRHQAAKGHSLALLLILWGMVLGAIEVLPRIGYATPTVNHPQNWTCS